MRAGLARLDAGLPRNPHVKVTSRRGGWITVSPLRARPDPESIEALKAEVTAIWPMTSLLDIVKETDLRLGFTDALGSPTAYETLDRGELRPRLLLCLYGLGTNTGLRRLDAVRDGGPSYRDLTYARRRYLTPDRLREAIVTVTNGTLRLRDPAIWGEGTTACASDSKHFGAWDQNLTTQWHVRYGGRGVMIYWHVERNSLCIHSQLKSPSSSEVASMIEGVLRHCTEMAVDRQYVDSHGQSVVAFAFTKLLGFQLLPRLKRIGKQRLYRLDAGQPDAYARLQPVLSRPIDWELIRRQYDEMVKYATALRLGTAEAEAILRRFTRENVQHPTYRALLELGHRDGLAARPHGALYHRRPDRPEQPPQRAGGDRPGLGRASAAAARGRGAAYAMFRDYWKYDWVLPVHRYEGLELLLATMVEKVIVPAEAKVRALAERRRAIEAELIKPSLS